MTAKFGEARRKAFFAALEETGNKTLAAERAKVSRSWVKLHVSSDPAFRRAMDEAVAQAAKRLGGRLRPPSNWGFLDGHELVVKGGNGRRVQIARARLKQWSPRVEERFLSVLAATCNVRAASAAVGMHSSSAYDHRRRWQGFAERWDEAVEIGYSRLECGLVEHAGNVFSGEGPGVFAEVPPMTVAQAVHLLHMHKHQVHGLGKAPGKHWKRPQSLDDPGVREAILRKLEMVLATQEVDQAQRAQDEAEWARRRPS